MIDVTKTVYYRNKPVLFLGTTPDGRLIFQTQSKIGRAKTILVDRKGRTDDGNVLLSNEKADPKARHVAPRYTVNDKVWYLYVSKQVFLKGEVIGRGKGGNTYKVRFSDGSTKDVMSIHLYPSFEDAVSYVESLRKSLYAQDKLLAGPTTVIRKAVGNAAGAAL